MFNRDIYVSALSLLGLGVGGENASDLEERAPYLIASFCCSAKEIDATLRKAEELGAQPSFNSVFLELDSEFPLCDRLSSCAALYVAAMLIIDEDPELSDSLYDKYCAAIAPFSSAISDIFSLDDEEIYDDSYAVCESIIEKYFFD